MPKAEASRAAGQRERRLMGKDGLGRIRVQRDPRLPAGCFRASAALIVLIAGELASLRASGPSSFRNFRPSGL